MLEFILNLLSLFFLRQIFLQPRQYLLLCQIYPNFVFLFYTEDKLFHPKTLVSRTYLGPAQFLRWVIISIIAKLFLINSFTIDWAREETYFSIQQILKVSSIYLVFWKLATGLFQFPLKNITNVLLVEKTVYEITHRIITLKEAEIQSLSAAIRSKIGLLMTQKLFIAWV